MARKLLVGEKVIYLYSRSRDYGKIGTVTVAERHFKDGSLPICRVQFPAHERDSLVVASDCKRIDDVNLEELQAKIRHEKEVRKFLR